MGNQTVTLNVPEQLYMQIQHAADITHRSVSDVLLEAAATMVTLGDSTTPALAQMAYMSMQVLQPFLQILLVLHVISLMSFLRLFKRFACPGQSHKRQKVIYPPQNT